MEGHTNKAWKGLGKEMRKAVTTSANERKRRTGAEGVANPCRKNPKYRKVSTKKQCKTHEPPPQPPSPTKPRHRYSPSRCSLFCHPPPHHPLLPSATAHFVTYNVHI